MFLDFEFVGISFQIDWSSTQVLACMFGWFLGVIIAKRENKKKRGKRK